MQSKDEIRDALASTLNQLSNELEQLTQEQFVVKPVKVVWSIAEEFDHVLKSNTAIASALKVMPLSLKIKFGRPNRPLRSYDEVKNRYNEKLSLIKGAQAPANFRTIEGDELNKEHMLSHWKSTTKKLDTRIQKWSDRNLNNTLLPHPLLGKVMVREILYFTHFHTLHHIKSIRKKSAAL